jgi:hypothetical protein
MAPATALYFNLKIVKLDGILLRKINALALTIIKN